MGLVVHYLEQGLPSVAEEWLKALNAKVFLELCEQEEITSMANSRLCTNCAQGRVNACQGRFQAPSQRGAGSGGSQPKQESYSYKCPTLGQVE